MNATKRFFLVLTVMCGLAGTMASCEDCEECDEINPATGDKTGKTEEFCDDDLEDAKEARGWDC